MQTPGGVDRHWYWLNECQATKGHPRRGTRDEAYDETASATAAWITGGVALAALAVGGALILTSKEPATKEASLQANARGVVVRW